MQNTTELSGLPALVASQPTVADDTTSKGKKAAEKKANDSNKPKRPLSAYNLFFQFERNRILQDTPERSEGKPRRSHGKIGFASLARNIATKWKTLDGDAREYFEDLAAEDKARYKQEKKQWKKAEAGRKASSADSNDTARDEQLKSTMLLEKNGGSANKSAPACISGDNLPFPHSDIAVPVSNVSQPHAAYTNDTFWLQGNHAAAAMEPFSLLPQNAKPEKSLSCNNSDLAHLKGPKRAASFSLLQAASGFTLKQSLLTGRNHVPSASYAQIPRQQQMKRPDISELVAKLDDECMDLLSDLL